MTSTQNNKSLRPYKGIVPQLKNHVYIDEACVLVGDITLDDDSSVWPLVAARGDVNYISIGKKNQYSRWQRTTCYSQVGFIT